ncbi:hypothetical protein ABIA33_004918 [Streptacidiphilus sp. MAP12-16]
MGHVPDMDAAACLAGHLQVQAALERLRLKRDVTARANKHQGDSKLFTL